VSIASLVVRNDSDGHTNMKIREILAQQFASRGQVVIEVPFDSHLRPGGVIDVATMRYHISAALFRFLRALRRHLGARDPRSPTTCCALQACCR
jgi:hypothetical protein